MVEIKELDDKFELTFPYNKDVISKIKDNISKQFREYDFETKTWSIHKMFLPMVKPIMVEYFGLDGTKNEYVMIKLTAKREITSGDCDAIYFGKFPLCTAYGRDTSTKMIGEVSKLSGFVVSGGSSKYWKTIVRKGTEFIVNIPKKLIDNEDVDFNYWEIDYEI